MNLDETILPGISYRSVRNAMRAAYRLRGYRKNFPELVRLEAVREALLRDDEPPHYASMIVKKAKFLREYRHCQKYYDAIPTATDEEIVEALMQHNLIFFWKAGHETSKGTALRHGDLRPIAFENAADIVRSLVAEADRYNVEPGPLTYLTDIHLVGMRPGDMVTDIHLLVAFERRIGNTEQVRSLRDYLGKVNKRVAAISKTTCTGFTEEERMHYIDEEPTRRLFTVSRRVVIDEYIQREFGSSVDFRSKGQLIYRFDSPLICDMDTRRIAEAERAVAQRFVRKMPSGPSISA